MGHQRPIGPAISVAQKIIQLWFKDIWVLTHEVCHGKHLQQDDSFLSVTVLVYVDKNLIQLWGYSVWPCYDIAEDLILLKHLLKQFLQV